MPRQKRTRTVRHRVILDRLDPVHHPALEELLLRKGSHAKVARAWLAALGVHVPLGTVCRYRDHLLAERQRRRWRDAEVEDEAWTAVRYAEIARDEDLPDFTAASVTLCQMLMMETVLRLRNFDFTPQLLRQYIDALMAIHEVDARSRLRRPDPSPPSLN